MTRTTNQPRREQTSTPVRRRVDFDFTTTSDVSTWYAGDRVKTAFLNAYTLLIPEGEKFVIRTVREFRDHYCEELRERVSAMFFQEGSHSNEHRKAVDWLEAGGVSVRRFMRGVDFFCYRLLEPCFPRVVALSTAAGIEHVNAVIAEHFLRERHLERSDSEMARLFLWHFAEEIEHKEVAFQALTSVTRSYSLRALGLVMAVANFVGLLMLGTLKLLLEGGQLRDGRSWREGVSFLFRDTGFLRTLARGCVEYLRPSFAPDPRATEALLEETLEAIGAQGIHAGSTRESQSPEPVRSNVTAPAARGMPPRMKRFLAKLERFRTAFPFFFEPTQAQAIAWIRSGGRRKVNLCTYSYLGLLKHPEIVARAKAGIERFGTGTHGVRLLGGTLDIHGRLEAHIASFLGREACITFSSGYVANVSVIGALYGPGTVVFCDSANHASIQDGCRLSGAKVVAFSHHDLATLTEPLAALPERTRKLIVVDGVYSMDGDIVDLPGLIDIKRRHANTCLMVDEAHALGVVGASGRGTEEHFGVEGGVDLLIGTLSKTIPAQGGFAVASTEIVDFLRHHARGYVFSAALSPASVEAADAAFDVLEREGASRRRQLAANISYFSEGLRRLGFDVMSADSAIIPVLIGSEVGAFQICQFCNDRGVALRPVVFPAVRKGTERIRANVTSEHSRADLAQALAILGEARTALGLAAETDELLTVAA